MSANRKLQAEIDRVLKRVTEGIAEFNAIWEKVHNAPNPNLKEKHEADLKREIKKLQRYRDQIKTWASSNEIKNKKPLLDARKDIETEMERFKVLERETKTKAYSKEGLTMRERSKKDPTASPNFELYQWIEKTRAALKEQRSQFERDIDSYRANKKKGVDFQSLQEWVERHQRHLDQLKLVKRQLKQGLIAPEMVADVQEDVDFYVESNQEPDFYEDEAIYDEIMEAADEAESKGLGRELSSDEDESDSEMDAFDEEDDDDDEHAAARRKVVEEKKAARAAAAAEKAEKALQLARQKRELEEKRAKEQKEREALEAGELLLTLADSPHHDVQRKQKSAG